MRQKLLGNDAEDLEPSDLFTSSDPVAIMGAIQKDQELVTQLQVKQGLLEFTVNEKLAKLPPVPHLPTPPSEVPLPPKQPDLQEVTELNQPIPVLSSIPTTNGSMTVRSDAIPFSTLSRSAIFSALDYIPRIGFLVVTIVAFIVFANNPTLSGDGNRAS